MSKIIGVENTERINAELEKLIEEVKKRTKTTITGVRIPDLGEAQTIDGSEMIIVEGTLRNNNYTDSNGVKHYSYNVVADSVSFGESKSASNP